jgi:DNA-binding MarR family transcriptional regulator
MAKSIESTSTRSGKARTFMTIPEIKIAACLGKAGKITSISELARESHLDRRYTREALQSLVSKRIVKRSKLNEQRFGYSLVGMSLPEIKALEKTNLKSTKKAAPARPERDPNAPTENEAKILKFLGKPATQEDIAAKFNLGKSRRSEVARSMLTKGLIKRCGTIGQKGFYVRTDIPDDKAKKLMNARRAH